jgi:phenylalanyl-tRNA synthetase alpha chain
VGNSGVFRPEVLRPMGLPEDVTVILYGIDNIRELFGHKVSLGMVKSNPMCLLGF